MFNEVITLVNENKQVNEYGDLVITETERTIFADLKSVTQTEFYQAQAVGIKAEIKFVIADFLDYRNEQKIKYTPYNASEELFTVVRTYRKGNQLEIICRKGVE